MVSLPLLLSVMSQLQNISSDFAIDRERTIEQRVPQENRYEYKWMR
jgi:hypothetical protein